MPFEPHTRVTAIGTLGNGAERFSWNLCLAYTGAPGALPQAGLADIAASIKACHKRPATRLAIQATLRSVKFASIGADGKYTADPVEIAVTDGAGSMPDAPQTVLPQNALAISLETNRRGASGRGRFYLPMPVCNSQPENGYQIDSTQANGIAVSVQTMLNEILNAPGLDNVNNSLDPVLVVASTKGFNSPVTGVRVGRIVDTIRSRRRALVENYTSVLPVS